MNYELTIHAAQRRFTLNNNPDILLDLPPSQTMEETGNIFNPNYYAVDTDTQIVYRKEQFLYGELPQELLVRDRRFRKTEIIEMCISVGLCVEWAR